MVSVAGLAAISRQRVRHACAGVVITWGLVAVAPPAETDAQGANLTRGCVEAFDAKADYFPDKVAIEDAINFRVEYRRSYKVVTLKEPYAGGPPERYVLVQCGAPAPALEGSLADAQVVTVPIASLFAFSTTHLSLLVDLDRVDVLTGVSALSVIDSPLVEARIKAGKVVEFAKVGLVVDAERVVTSKPALLMAGGASNPTLPVIRSAGIPVVANTEWLESTALGRAEWLKYMALFLNEERKAQGLYGAMKGRYRALSARATALPESARPLVMAGRSTRGTFVIAGGRSYVASLIAHAGGRYVWTDNTAVGSASVDFEAQLRRAANADIWINGGGWTSLAAMLDDEPRYAEFKAYQRRQVWVYERRLTPAGGNDYWSRSITHPDIVLADLVKIFHPALMPTHAFEWYMPVPGR
jgi:iron complex transport system substrate-binding protein